MKKFKYIIFTFDGGGCSIAKKLIDEGRETFLVQIQDSKDMPKGSWMNEDESPEKKKRRLSIYDGIIEKYTDAEMLKSMKSIENKEDYFVFFDFNSLYEFAEKCLDMGFTNGIFPLEKDYELEQDRQLGKDIAKKNLKGIRVDEVFNFKKVKDGIDFLNEHADKIFALKSDGNNANTIVPLTNNPEFAKKELIIQLMDDQKDYEKGGFTFEEKIMDIIEVCPQICFYNGKPIYTEIEMETRLIGSGDIGFQTGGNQNIVMQTKFSDKINKIAFPPFVFEEAKKRKGIYLKDCGMLFDKKGIPHFSEFAGNRYSWGGVFSELSMAQCKKGCVSEYFETLASGKNPYKYKFGSTIGIYNLEPDGKYPDLSKQDIPVQWEKSVEPRFFPYQVRIDDKKNKETEENEPIVVNVGTRDILNSYYTGFGNSLVEAANMAYGFANKVSFNGMYYRPKFDMLSTEYVSSIPNRIKFLKNHRLIS